MSSWGRGGMDEVAGAGVGLSTGRQAHARSLSPAPGGRACLRSGASGAHAACPCSELFLGVTVLGSALQRLWGREPVMLTLSRGVL